ncbi:MAG: MBL fold metallo-hydrolase [Candidatus Latescibacteria bacterium]|nr:MBL fold metallo-hydrolase [Candidatus Latescibacterota bacterium]
MKVCVLASGSGGNAVYVQEGPTRVLIDAGLTGRKVEDRLRAIDVDPGSLQAIVVTHEHADHIRGAGVLARRFRLPVWMTGGTLEASRETFRGVERVRRFENDEAFDFGDLRFQPFTLSHDAADPVNFVVEGGEARLGIATDLGVVTQLVYQRLRGADLVVMETNHDRDLLMNGSYSWDLKRRIGGNRGHLSNGKAAEALCSLAEEGLRQALLAHLSDENNRPDLAEGTCRSELEGRGVRDFALTVLQQDRPSPIFVI